jgi:transposase
MNMFIRSHARFKIEAEKAKAVLRVARVVASDETGARIEGTNSYHWVFHCKDAVVHQSVYSRAARVWKKRWAGTDRKCGFRIATRPSNRTASATRPLAHLAHLARDTALALEHGSDDLPLRFKLWFGKAFDLAGAIAELTASTLARKKRELEKRLASLLAAGTELQAKIARAQSQLLTFCDFPARLKPPTMARNATPPPA